MRLNVENSNFNINWIDIVRTGGTFNDNPSPTNDNFGLNPNRDPWDNFDLRRWAIDTPAERSDDRCRAERTWEYEWTDSDPLGSRSRPFFFTHSDGGMRFVTRIDGATTNSSCNSGFVRSELREMLRAGDRMQHCELTRSLPLVAQVRWGVSSLVKFMPITMSRYAFTIVSARVSREAASTFHMKFEMAMTSILT